MNESSKSSRARESLAVIGRRAYEGKGQCTALPKDRNQKLTYQKKIDAHSCYFNLLVIIWGVPFIMCGDNGDGRKSMDCINVVVIS
jgi:hypothetical protein